MSIRKLEVSDYHKGYLRVLKGLTDVGEITYEQFMEQLEHVPDIYVLEERGQIVGTATLLVEYKIHHQCGKVGHIEDVVVLSECRGRGYGLKLVEFLVERAKEQNCYKVILDCAEHNVPFYEKCGFKTKEVEMVHYFQNE